MENENSQSRKLVAKVTKDEYLKFSLSTFVGTCYQHIIIAKMHHWKGVGLMNGHLVLDDFEKTVRKNMDLIVEAYSGHNDSTIEDFTFPSFITNEINQSVIVKNLIVFVKKQKTQIVDSTLITLFDNFIADLYSLNYKSKKLVQW